LKAVMMASWQRADRSAVILHSDRGTQFTSAEYQQFLKDHHIVSSISDVGRCGDNAAAEGFFGKLKRQRFDPVAAAGHHLYCYLDGYYVARISLDGDHCGIDGPGIAPCEVPSEDEAREVVRMWVRLGTGR